MINNGWVGLIMAAANMIINIMNKISNLYNCVFRPLYRSFHWAFHDDSKKNSHFQPGNTVTILSLLKKINLDSYLCSLCPTFLQYMSVRQTGCCYLSLWLKECMKPKSVNGCAARPPIIWQEMCEWTYCLLMYVLASVCVCVSCATPCTQL